MEQTLKATLIIFGICFLLLIIYAGYQIGGDISNRSVPVIISLVVVIGILGMGLLTLAGMALSHIHQTANQQDTAIKELKEQIDKVENEFSHRLSEKIKVVNQSIKDRQPLSTKDRIDQLLKIAEKMQVTKEIKEGEKQVVKKKIPEEIVLLIKKEIEGMREVNE